MDELTANELIGRGSFLYAICLCKASGDQDFWGRLRNEVVSKVVAKVTGTLAVWDKSLSKWNGSMSRTIEHGHGSRIVKAQRATEYHTMM